MTDDQLETLLRDTFRSREALADPGVAQDVARSVVPRSRRWPAYVAVAAAVVVIALVGAFLVDRTTEPPVTRPSPPPPASTSTYRDNRATALAEAQRVVRLVPLSDGAVEVDASSWPGGELEMSPSDPMLRQTVVWAVPGHVGAVGDHLRAQSLDGAPAVNGGSSQSDDGPTIPALDYTVPASAPSAMTDTTVMVQWVQDGDRALVRADTFTAARTVRTAATYVDVDVSAVDIERVVRHSPRNQRLPTVHLTAPDDSADIAGLVDAANGLFGSFRPAQEFPCPPVSGPAPMTRLTFHSGAGETTYDLVDWCFGQVEVRRDGTMVRPTLDPGDLNEAVESAVGAR